jgi:hypothetical protein
VTVGKRDSQHFRDFMTKSKKLNKGAGRERSHGENQQKTEGSDGVISRDAFLAGRVLSMSVKLGQLQSDEYCLRSMSAAAVSPLLRPSTPPTVEPPPGLEDLDTSVGSNVAEQADTCNASEKEPGRDVNVLASEPPNYKVLLQNLPEAMLKECMLRAMLEQAKLSDILSLQFRCGKALITFTTLASVSRCIHHFHDRQWGTSNAPVVALYVRTVSKAQPLEAKAMSATAPVFVPKALQSSILSADAPSFVPSADKPNDRDRIDSYASTDIGPTSDEASASDRCDSDNEAAAVCT